MAEKFYTVRNNTSKTFSTITPAYLEITGPAPILTPTLESYLQRRWKDLNDSEEKD